MLQNRWTFSDTARKFGKAITQPKDGLLDKTGGTLKKISFWDTAWMKWEDTHLSEAYAQFTISMHDYALERLIEDVCHARADIGEEANRISNEVCWP